MSKRTLGTKFETLLSVMDELGPHVITLVKSYPCALWRMKVNIANNIPLEFSGKSFRELVEKFEVLLNTTKAIPKSSPNINEKDKP
jgi:hypothetical protein